MFPLEWHDPTSGEISSGYRESGYLPEAVVNFLALLGWNPGDDTEVMSMQELIDKFSFAHCSRSGAKFAYEKGKWFNHVYLENTPDDELARLFKPLMEAAGVDMSQYSDEYIARAVGTLKSRINFVKDLVEQAAFYFVAPQTYNPKDVKKRWSAETPALMARLIEILDALPDFKATTAEPAVMEWIKSNELHMGNVMNAFRLAVVGECKGPHMFEITEIMGKDETLRRLKAAIDNIKLDEPTV